MQLTEEQIISFQKLYKEKLGIELTKSEALAKALSLIRFMRLHTVPLENREE